MNVTELLTNKMRLPDFAVRNQALSEICEIIINDKITKEGKLLVLDYSLKILFVDVGKTVNNYYRSSNLCVIQCILEDNLDKNYIEDDKLVQLFSIMIEYLSLEFIELGYDNKFGMIHTLAHIADVFVTLFDYKCINNSENFKKYFELVVDRYCSLNYVFITDEAARILRVFNTYYINFNNVEYIIGFLDEYKSRLTKGIKGLNQRQNYYNFLHTLHFFTNDMELLRFIVEELERKYKRYIDGIL
ncbi:MAG: DUF2785 domain-containing protein [Bacilli bacterium]